MKKCSCNYQLNSRFILEELEARQLYSGGIEGLIDTALTTPIATYINADNIAEQRTIRQDETSTASTSEQQTQEIVFVDTGIADYQILLDDLLANYDSNRNIEVVLLNSNQNGIEQISDTLLDRHNLDVIHIISHSDDDTVTLGNTSLKTATLEKNNQAISRWANLFAETGNILIYGCNLAVSQTGQNLINTLSQLTLTVNQR